MVNILDCTIRDGSYVTNYQWDNKHLQQIVDRLSKAGVPYIEIGNGTGLGMYRSNASAKNDKEYFENTIPYKNHSKIGAFFIPGIGNEEDIHRFKDEGGDFLRIGVNATEVVKALPYVKFAKNLGFEVFCNLMKSYSVTTYQLAYACSDLVDSGVDCIYIVDSAGGMTPIQVQEYFSAINKMYEVKLGFHGHNNLLLANGNSYMAAISGASFVDATLMTLGRGAGNAQLESLVALFQKDNLIDDSIDVKALCELSEEIIKEILDTQSVNLKRNIVIGVANFHDSYLNIAEKYAKKYNVDVDLLITEVSKINMVNPSEELFDLVASKITTNTISSIYFPKFYHKNY